MDRSILLRPRAFCPTLGSVEQFRAGWRNTRKRGRALRVLAIAGIKCLAAIVARARASSTLT